MKINLIKFFLVTGLADPILSVARIKTVTAPVDLKKKATNEKVAEIIAASGGNNVKAYNLSKTFLEELRSSLAPDHPAVAYVAAFAGSLAVASGKYKEAEKLLNEGLPIITKELRDGQLMRDEFELTAALINALDELNKDSEAMAVLDRLIKRARESISQLGPDTLLKSLQATDDAGREMGLAAALPSEEWLLLVLERSGRLHKKTENWAKCEASYKEAWEIIQKNYPEKQLAITTMREGWEEAARRQGKVIRPKIVGKFGHPRMIEFDGVDAIAPDDIRSALRRSSAFILASHPAADFDDYLKKIKRCLELGYQNEGLPDATVAVDWDDKNGSIKATVQEGVQYKKGDILIEGVGIMSEDDLREHLLFKEGNSITKTDLSDQVYSKIEPHKRLPPDEVKGAIADKLPALAALQAQIEKQQQAMSGKPADAGSGNKELDSFLENLSPKASSDELPPGFWKPGTGVSYLPSTLNHARGFLHSIYAREGNFFPEFEVEWSPRRADGLVDLKVTVVKEGPTIELGDIHVSGNRVNSREELLEFLELAPGMPMKGDVAGRLKRKLYESGRFLGWEIIMHRRSFDSNKMDLLLMVEEQWEAPPLSAPLNRAQQTMLNFAAWMNGNSGVDSDLVISYSAFESDLGPMEIKLAVNREAIAWSADIDDIQREFCGVIRWKNEGKTEIIIHRDGGDSFRAAFPANKKSIPLDLFSLVVEKVSRRDPFQTRMFQYGGNTSTSMKSGGFAFGIDPAGALAQVGSSYRSTGTPWRFADGTAIFEDADGTLRIDEKSGQLISYSLKGNELEGEVTVRMEEGAIGEMEAKMAVMAQGIPNWLDGKKPSALLLRSLAYLGELSLDEEIQASENFVITAEMLDRVGEVTATKWDPPAILASEVLSSLAGMFQSSDKMPSFVIPPDSENFQQQLQAGNNLTLLLSLGFYDLLADNIEPGSWPDKVIREIMFIVDGKPFYLNQTIGELLADESMGPIGCMICSYLADSMSHNSAGQFARKAKAELNREGFKKDWSLLLSGKAEDAGIGWNLLGALQKLTETQVDGFLPADPPEIRTTFNELVSTAREIEPQSNAAALEPVMNSLWDHFMADVIGEMAEATRESVSLTVDPKLVAATVNGHPVFRGAVKLNQRLNAGKVKGGDPEWIEDTMGPLLFAQEMWAQGQVAQGPIIKQRAEMVAQSLGLLESDGWDQIAEMGMNRAQFEWWIGVQIANQVRMNQVIQTGSITDAEIREFYDEKKEMFVSAPKSRVYALVLEPKGDGAPEKKLAEEIRERISQAGDMEAMVTAFKAEVKKHSHGPRDKGGDLGRISPGEYFFPDLANAIDAVPEESLSEVIETSVPGKRFVHLVLIPEKRKPGELMPFERIKPGIRNLAIIDKELKRLKKKAYIEVHELKPETEIAAEEMGGSGGGLDGVSSLAENLISSFTGDGGEEEPDAGPLKDPLPVAGEENLPVEEQVIRSAGRGNPRDIYRLGALAEMGKGPEPGIEAAIKLYLRAEKVGSISAMRRLAEIYRLGIGVDPDPKKAKEFLDRSQGILPKRPPKKNEPEDSAAYLEFDKAMEAKEYAEALHHAESVRDQFPDSFTGWFALGKVYESQELDQKAIDSYRKATELDIRGESDAIEGLGSLLLKSGETAQSASDYFAIGFAEMDVEDDAEKMLAYFQKGMELYPENALMHAAMGYVFLEIPDHTEEGVASLQRAIQLNPKLGALPDVLADGFDLLGKPEAVIETWWQAIEADPDNSEHYAELAQELYERFRQVDGSLALLRRGLEFDPLRPRTSIGYILVDSGRLEEGISVLQQTIDLDPEDGYAHFFLGNALVESGKPDEGVRYLKRAIELDPENGYAHLALGEFLVESGGLEEGIIHLERAVELEPDDVEFMVGLLAAWFKSGEMDRFGTWTARVVLFEREGSEGAVVAEVHDVLKFVSEEEGTADQQEEINDIINDPDQTRIKEWIRRARKEIAAAKKSVGEKSGSENNDGPGGN